MRKHPDAIAWEKWKSGRGKKCVKDTSILGSPQNQSFLENRLLCAFIAGIEHGRKQAKKEQKV